jgi:Holliday junction resolvase RusA-like endonuclease
MNSVRLDIVPVPKPRMTQSDRWKSRPCTARYWEFKENLINLFGGLELHEQVGLIFTMPMPDSWSDKKKLLMNGKPHQAKPDIDNLVKSIFDCLAESDSYIWRVDAVKYWGRNGSIEISDLGESVND